MNVSTQKAARVTHHFFCRFSVSRSSIPFANDSQCFGKVKVKVNGKAAKIFRLHWEISRVDLTPALSKGEGELMSAQSRGYYCASACAGHSALAYVHSGNPARVSPSPAEGQRHRRGRLVGRLGNPARV